MVKSAAPEEHRLVEAEPASIEAGAPKTTKSMPRLRKAFNNKWVLRGLVYGSILAFWQYTAIRKGEFFLPKLETIGEGLGTVVTEGYYLTILTTFEQLIAGL